MNPEPLKRRHHTAPKSYLLGFAGPDGRVTVRRRSGDEFTQHVGNVTVRKDFYNFIGAEGTRQDDIEDWFMKEIESPVAPVLRRLRDTPDPDRVSTDDGAMMGRFVAAQLYRTATARAYMEQIDAHVGPMLMASDLSQRMGIDLLAMSPTARERLWALSRRLLAEHGNPDDVRASRLRTTLREIDQTITKLQSWSWEVAVTPQPRLITGDAPAVAIQKSDGGFTGVLPPDSPVYLPLSPNNLLIGRPRPSAHRTALTARLARQVNQRIADEAADAIVKSPAHPWPPQTRLTATAPRLPTPTIRLERSDGAPPTFPARYAPVSAPGVRALLDKLNATDEVV